MTARSGNVVDLVAYRAARAPQRSDHPFASYAVSPAQFPMTAFPTAYAPMFVPVMWVPYWVPAVPTSLRLAAGAEDA